MPRRRPPAAQIAMESVLTEGCQRVEYWAGYSFQMRRSPLMPWITGVVSTPQNLPNGALALPLMLDNGAYPAWLNERDLTLSDQLDPMLAVIDQRPVAYAVVPDIVGGGEQSWRRTIAALPSLMLAKNGTMQLLLAVQEGIPVDRVVELARDIGGGIFVGGRTWAFKARTMKTLEGVEMRVHVGAVSTDGHVHACAASGVTAIDNTTWVSGRANKPRHAYRRTVERYVTLRG